MATELWWYVARAGGIVAWALLAAGVVWGLLLSAKVLGRRPRKPWMLDLHRFLGGCAVVFIAIHVVSIVFDSYVHFGVVDVLVPFAGSWKPTAVAWGVVSMYMVAAVEITSLLRRRLSKRAWHLTHLLSFPLFFFSTLHGLTAGTDASGVELRLAMVATTVVVLALTLIRIVQALLPVTPAAQSPRIPIRSH